MFENEDHLKNIKEYIVSSTVNFSADSYRKFLDYFFNIFFRETDKKKDEKKYENIEYWIYKLTKELRELSQEVKNYLGSQTIIDIIKQKDEYIKYLTFHDYEDFKK